ncbi:chorismate mutase [Thermogymnomonas acidicola]|uniref:chorismate mutase n=1 Tax=Thermogymnomonas acidicola TaxID=399579 RepID=UPI000946888B|nr:chorismate mutase [Thermogymnomonas acidicola]
MVHFIARESDPGKCIEDLRKEMLSNTLSILRLLNERRRIAVEIGRAKTSGLPARVPEQEERVIRQIGSDDPVVARDINLLFELSTQWQKRSDISAPPGRSAFPATRPGWSSSWVPCADRRAGSRRIQRARPSHPLSS